MRTSAAAPVLVLFLVACAGCATGSGRPSSDVRQSFREGAGRTLVMLGGGVYGAAMFAPHARELSTDFDVVRVETLNVQTAKTGGAMPPDYSVAHEASALRDTLDALGVVGAVDVVGASYGAVVALHFAVRYPERVKTLILFEPPAFWVLAEEEFARDATLREMRSLTRTMTSSSAPSDEQFYRFRCLLGACPAAIPAPNDPARMAWDRSRQAMRGLAAVPAHREDPRLVARLRHPVLLLQGSETIGFHRRINEVLAAMLPHVETAELPGGHAAPRTAVSEFVVRIRDFLR